mmetsp:Transcript_13183/g.19851  ORF Transcript_13183/g.19851 Transcript_13183/m.19851 type:complete len:274 (-) Transcript_13183:7-828(-)
MDRGYGHISAQRRLWEEDGIYSNSMIQGNRIGLPRELITQVAADLGACPDKCSHKPGAAGCRKFAWTVVHKPPFELVMWQDSQLILGYGNFFSSTRAGTLSRGGHGDAESCSVWAPEGIFHYNIEGRSATDSADQSRRKLAMSERRIERAGHKGISFVLDILFTNGASLQRMLQPDSTPRATLDKKYTKLNFCLRWVNHVLAKYGTCRKRSTMQLNAVAKSLSSSSAGIAHEIPLSFTSHTLIDTCLRGLLYSASSVVGITTCHASSSITQRV